MVELILSPRNTEDARKLREAAAQRGWRVTTLSSWRLPPAFHASGRLALYGEPLFARVVAAQCGHVLLEPPHAWLTRLPDAVTRRKIHWVTYQQLGILHIG